MWPEAGRTWQCTQVPFREDRTDHAGQRWRRSCSLAFALSPPVVYLDLLLDNDRERESYFAMLAVIPPASSRMSRSAFLNTAPSQQSRCISASLNCGLFRTSQRTRFIGYELARTPLRTSLMKLRRLIRSPRKRKQVEGYFDAALPVLRLWTNRTWSAAIPTMRCVREHLHPWSDVSSVPRRHMRCSN